ncbi:MAG: GTPase Era [Candidatus Melainabacteria bacterium]|nr:GTPase Era [Candidatus Melainabacteria bacterium]
MFRSGFVALVGRPNVGKSTLLNQLIGMKVAITSPVMQTTRHRIRGVRTSEKGQLVFLDTPGFSKPLDSLGHYLVAEGLAAVSEADAFVLVVDGSVPPGPGDAWVVEQLRQTGRFIWLVLNKLDRLKNDPGKKVTHTRLYGELLNGYAHWKHRWVSAKTNKNVETLADSLLRTMPEGPPYYPEDATTDQRLREMAAETVREKVLLHTREEIPHSVAIGVETFVEEAERGLTSITMTLYVDQESQKGILIGKNGSMLKTIGTQARQDLETLMEQQVFLKLQVKVRRNWRKDADFLKSLGLALPTGAG